MILYGTNFRVKMDGMYHEMNRYEFISYLICMGHFKHYENAPKKFQKETKIHELPTLYRTKAGYVYAVIK